MVDVEAVLETPDRLVDPSFNTEFDVTDFEVVPEATSDEKVPCVEDVNGRRGHYKKRSELRSPRRMKEFREGYDLAVEVGLPIPPHIISEDYIISEVVEGEKIYKSPVKDEVDVDELATDCSKALLIGCADLAVSNILVDENAEYRFIDVNTRSLEKTIYYTLADIGCVFDSLLHTIHLGQVVELRACDLAQHVVENSESYSEQLVSNAEYLEITSPRLQKRVWEGEPAFLSDPWIPIEQILHSKFM